MFLIFVKHFFEKIFQILKLFIPYAFKGKKRQKPLHIAKAFNPSVTDLMISKIPKGAEVRSLDLWDYTCLIFQSTHSGELI